MIAGAPSRMARDSTETVMALAASNSNPRRTAVPIHVAHQIGPDQGSRVKWNIGNAGREWIDTVRKGNGE